MTQPFTLCRQGDRAVLAIDHPPGNALAPAGVAGRAAAPDAFAADRACAAPRASA